MLRRGRQNFLFDRKPLSKCTITCGCVHDDEETTVPTAPLATPVNSGQFLTARVCRQIPKEEPTSHQSRPLLKRRLAEECGETSKSVEESSKRAAGMCCSKKTKNDASGTTGISEASGTTSETTESTNKERCISCKTWKYMVCVSTLSRHKTFF